MEIFATGGTGYMGRALVRALVPRGHRVTVLARRTSLDRVPAGATPCIGDALDAESFVRAIPRGATLVHLVGTPHPNPSKAAEFERIDLASLRQSVAAALRAEAGHVVYVSVAQPAPAPVAAPAAASAAKEIAWADMNKDQRLEYMKSVVAPRMKQVFVNFSPDRFSKMNCMTCHGDSAADGSFKMPNPRLPKLPTTPDGFKKLAAEKPAVMDFMKNEVKPKMAALLGAPEYNPETKSGFGCMECHTTAQ